MNSPAPSTPAPNPSAASRHPKMTRLLLILLILASGLIILGLIVASQRFDQIVGIGKRLQTYEQRADGDPAALAAPDATPRLETMLSIRRAAIAHLGEDFEHRIAQLVSTPSEGRTATVMTALNGIPALDRAIDAYIDALDEAAMSPADYRLLLGDAIATALASGDQPTDYRAHLESLDQYASRITPDTFAGDYPLPHLVRDRYARDGISTPRSVVDELNRSTLGHCLFDLVILGANFEHSPEQSQQTVAEGPLQ